MIPISITADAALDVVRRLASGELEISGIQIRDAVTKQIRYVIRGAENLPQDLDGLDGLPPLAPLQAAIGSTQMLQLVAVAQNAAMAMTLRRIEDRLVIMEGRLASIEQALQRSALTNLLILDGIRAAPISRLQAAKSAAIVAKRHADKTALNAAAKDAEQAARDLLAQAKHLINRHDRGLPAAFLHPDDLANLAESAVEAACIASAIWLALGKSEDVAQSLMEEASKILAGIRQALAEALSSPDLLLRRTEMDQRLSISLQATGLRLRNAMLQASGRATLIQLRQITHEPIDGEFERLSLSTELVFLPVPDHVQA